MTRPTDEQVRALAEFAVHMIESARDGAFFDENDRELVLVAAAEDGILKVTTVHNGGVVVEIIPDWLLEAAGQHTLQSEDATDE